MGSFSVAGYFLIRLMIFAYKKCTKIMRLSKKRFERLAVSVKITASCSQKTVNNPIMSQNKAVNENLRTFNLMQN